jgi:hypothetical protein
MKDLRVRVWRVPRFVWPETVHDTSGAGPPVEPGGAGVSAWSDPLDSSSYWKIAEILHTDLHVLHVGRGWPRGELGTGVVLDTLQKVGVAWLKSN